MISIILAALLAIHPVPVAYTADGLAYVDVGGQVYAAQADAEATQAIVINGQCIVW